jgi:nicotinamidase-related amidase
MGKALLIIDLQMAMQHRIDDGRDHVNPEAPARVAALAAAFRRKGWPVIHVRHQDADPASPFHPDAPGCRPMPCAEAQGNEPVFVKRTSSAFASTDLADYLRRIDCAELVVTGAVAGFCIDSTVRAGADLGFRMTVVRDAILGFDLPARQLSARSVFDVAMALLDSDFAEMVDTSAVLPA